MFITGYRLEKLHLTCDPPISDSQTDDDAFGIAYLELETDTGKRGIGFEHVPPSTAISTLRKQFHARWSALEGSSPFHLKARKRRPRGDAYPRSSAGGLDRAMDIALWDLCGKHLGMPLYELLGGDNPTVRTYVSGIHFTLEDTEARRLFTQYADRGFDAAKVKVGYPSVEEDLSRLELVCDAMDDPVLTVDANEAWDPKEAIRRVRTYNEAGYDIEWVEDPVLRDDVEGLARVADALPFTHLNTGEYANLEGKRELLARGACEMLNIRNGVFSTAIEAATLARVHGVPTHVGQVPFHVGVHLAAALPEMTYLEYWPRPWDDLMSEPPQIDDGTMTAPDKPGHGVEFDADEVPARMEA